MTHVFLIVVFYVTGGSINTTTPMPSMEVCERMADYHMDDLPKSSTWTTTGISKPVDAICTEVTE